MQTYSSISDTQLKAQRVKFFQKNEKKKSPIWTRRIKIEIKKRPNDTNKYQSTYMIILIESCQGITLRCSLLFIIICREDRMSEYVLYVFKLSFSHFIRFWRCFICKCKNNVYQIRTWFFGVWAMLYRCRDSDADMPIDNICTHIPYPNGKCYNFSILLWKQ